MLLYHVTWTGALDSIARQGLLPGVRSNFGGGYEGHARGRTFLTSFEGLFYWYSKFQDLADHHSDNPVEDQLVPVVLAVEVEHEVHPDPLGTRDALAPAWFTTAPVTPDALLVWDGEDWAGLEDVDPEYLGGLAATVTEECDEPEDDEDEADCWVSVDWVEPEPLLPTEEPW